MDQLLQLGDHWSFNLRNDAKRFGFVLARYAFAARIASGKKNVLELGCSEGIGAPILKNTADSYTGVDLDYSAIQSAKRKFSKEIFQFIHDDFMGKKYGLFETVVSLDVVEHILPEYEGIYFSTIVSNLSQDGICVIGTPNITSASYASEASNLGHVNLYSMQRLVETLEKYFSFVLPFGMNDEVLHTAYAPMSHYLLVVAFERKPS